MLSLLKAKIYQKASSLVTFKAIVQNSALKLSKILCQLKAFYRQDCPLWMKETTPPAPLLPQLSLLVS
jgi:hypothetical protein